MDSTREDLPRVSVGTVQDWQRLKSNYKQAALDRLEEHVSANNLTHQREALLDHMNQFISRAFEKAQPNLRVNGRNFESLDENEQDMEPFDEALDRRIWTLADNRLQWHSKIAETRRTQPKDIEVLFHNLLNQQRAVDAEEESLARPDFEEYQDLEIDALSQRRVQIEEIFRKTSALGEELNQAIPVQLERSERVKAMAAEVKALKP